ncbi:MAG: acetyl-CoA carboxyl transferase [Chlamydiae bacterium SM23_39]|nr:MAG: acetyl-CoA carboxyl transferase [Chlamydiae bacterium SM23_39]
MKLKHEKEIEKYEKAINELKNQNKKNPVWTKKEISNLEKKLCELKEKVYSNLSPIERVAISRHPLRPNSLDYIKNICEEFEEIFGDRLFRNDNAIVTALGKINKKKFIFVGLEKGKDTNSRIYRNFGMAHPEGYRKALRAMKLAAKFNIPIVTFLDTPGAFPGLSAEERGQGWAIAKNLLEMSRLPTHIIVVLIGEGCSGGALGIGVGDKIGMLEHAYYSVISPEGCASILWKDSSKSDKAAFFLKMQAEDMLKLKIIDTIIKEPLGGAHHDLNFIYKNVKDFILNSLNELEEISIKELLDLRYRRFRNIGKFIFE